MTIGALWLRQERKEHLSSLISTNPESRHCPHKHTRPSAILISEDQWRLVFPTCIVTTRAVAGFAVGEGAVDGPIGDCSRPPPRSTKMVSFECSKYRPICHKTLPARFLHLSRLCQGGKGIAGHDHGDVHAAKRIPHSVYLTADLRFLSVVIQSLLAANVTLASTTFRIITYNVQFLPEPVSSKTNGLNPNTEPAELPRKSAHST